MKNIISKSGIVVVVLLLSSLTMLAQNTTHEVSVSLGGLNKMNYNRSEQIDKVKTKVGGSIGLGYTYHLNSVLGIRTGLEYSMYKSDLSLDYIYNKYLAVDNEQEAMIYRSAMRNAKEKHNIGYIQIPLMIQYTVKLTDSYSYYVAGGAKIGFATSKKYTIQADSLNTFGEYDGLGMIVTGAPERGFGEYIDVRRKGSLDLKASCMLALETGMKWKLDSKLSLYTGIYFDYSLNDINKRSGSHGTFVEYNEQDPIINSVANSAHNQLLDNTTIIKSMRPMALGVKLRLAFDL